MTEELRTLDLTHAEEKTLQVLLAGKTLSISALAREAILPRMTVKACLDRLHRRGLVRHVGTGYRSLWKIAGREKLQNQLWEGISYLDSKLSKAELSERLGVKISESTEFFAFQGVDNIQKLYLWFFLNHFGQRVRGIQPNLSSRTIMEKLGAEKVTQINDSVRQNRLIIEAILPESVKEAYRSMVDDPELLSSVCGRTTAVYLVPDSLLQFNADMILGNNIAIFANWQEEVAVLMRNPEFLKILNVLYDLLAQVGKSFDQNAYVASLIEQHQKSV